MEVPKVALLLPNLMFGGAERVVLNLAKALGERGFDVDILLMSNQGELLSEARATYTVVDLQCDKTYKLPARLIKYVWANRPCALFSSFWKVNLCACLIRALFPRMKLIVWEHALLTGSETPLWLYCFTASLLYRNATKVVAVSTGVRDDVLSITVGLKNKVVVISNPISPPSPTLLKAREGASVQHIVWVGRLTESKNPMLTLEAFAAVAGSRAITLTFVGDGLMRQSLEERTIQLGLDTRVIFTGYLDDPYKVLALADLLVLSSKQEGFGNVLVEAMYCGLGIVSTDCGGGIHDILLNSRYGTIVPNGNRESLAKAIENELDTPRKREEQLKGAQRYLPNVIVHEFLDVLGLA